MFTFREMITAVATMHHTTSMYKAHKNNIPIHYQMWQESDFLVAVVVVVEFMYFIVHYAA